MPINSAAVVGVGLIGGSLASAWRAADFVERIVGIEADVEAAEVALQLGLVDAIVEAVPDEAQLIAVCTPSDQIAQTIAGLRRHRGALFDVGSVKGPIVAQLTDELGALPGAYVPCHPIAGSERSGPQAASADLFKGATTVMTPTAATDSGALQQVREAWQATGAEVVEMSPTEHDEMLAVTSHLPHLLAFAFMQQVESTHLGYTGGGFRDFTRIAGANPELWWRILSMNKEQVIAAARHFTVNLDALTASLANDDAEAGLRALREAVARRQLQNP